MNTTFSDTFYPLKCSLLPSLPNNEGLTQFLEVAAPNGSIFNTQYPRAVRARSKTSFHIHSVIYSALALVLGKQVQAASGSFWTLVATGEWADGTNYRAHMLPNGGKGAVMGMDGHPTIAFPYNGTITPMEIFEYHADVIVRRRELIPGSGGAGRFRGGLGQCIEFEPASERPVNIFVRPDKTVHPPTGLLGGQPGRLGRILLNGRPAPHRPMTLHKGDILALELPGGGGCGDPSMRAPSAVENDLAAGYVFAEKMPLPPA